MAQTVSKFLCPFQSQGHKTPETPFYNICQPHLGVSHPCYLTRLGKWRGKGGCVVGWGLTSAGRVMVISDAPVGADLSGGPRAMWPDKPLAPESALVGRTQLAPDRPPLSPAQAPHHSQNPMAAATLTSPPGATATSYCCNCFNTQSGTHF